MGNNLLFMFNVGMLLGNNANYFTRELLKSYLSQ